MDWVPVISQVKSAVQASIGNIEGAKQTQYNFAKQCPIVSQATSVIQAVYGDIEAAKETQIEFFKNVGEIVDHVPIIGHAKGAIHYTMGQKEKGDFVMKKANTITEISSQIGAMMAGGPIAALAIKGTADVVKTGAESVAHREFHPTGIVATVTELVKGDVNKMSEVVDMAADVVITDKKVAKVTKDTIHTGLESATHGQFKPTGVIESFTELVKGDVNIVEGVMGVCADVVLDGKAAQLAKESLKTGAQTTSKSIK